MEAQFRVQLEKEDFKFSAAHFTVFARDEGELLHGHNYRVGVAVSGRRLNDLELLVDIAELKRQIRTLCAGLDSLTLIPADSPHLALTENGGEVEVRFASRRYVLPRHDLRLLPLRNISVESLARFLWCRLAAELDEPRLETLEVSVEETRGQCCAFVAPLAEREQIEREIDGKSEGVERVVAGRHVERS